MVQENALDKVSVTAEMLKEAINVMRGAVMICYPQGLPKWDVVQQVITGIFSCILLFFCFRRCVYVMIFFVTFFKCVRGWSSAKESLDPDTAHLWWAGKELMRDKCLKDYVGKNDKTKVGYLLLTPMLGGLQC